MVYLPCLQNKIMEISMKKNILFLILIIGVISLMNAEETYTKRKNNDVREGPGSYYRLIVTLPENTKLTVLERTSTWVKIQLPMNRIGWLAANNLVGRPLQKIVIPLENVWSSPKASKAGIAAAIKGFGEKYGKTDSGNVDRLLAYSEKGFVGSDLASFNREVRRYKSKNRDHLQLRDLDLDVPDYDVSLQEKQIGVGIAARIVARGLLENSELHRYVNLICAAVTENSSIYNADFTVYVLDDIKVNAFAVPGGYIFITKGMIQQCHDESELAGVIAHEIAHVVRCHGLQEISQRAVKIAADKAFDELEEEVGKTQVEIELEEMIDSCYNKVIHPRLIKYEFEADKVGAVFSANAGYDPFGLVRISERIARIPKEQSDIFDATFMAPNDAIERYNAISKFVNKQFETSNPGATMTERFIQNRIQ
jgi:hypothetical protein